MYTLVGHPKSRALRVLWALEEMGLPYEIRPDAPQSEGIRSINPLGKIPALIVDGTVFQDSVAIITFLADKHKQLTHEPGTKERAIQDGMTQFAVAEMDAALWLKGKHSFVLPEHMRVEANKQVAAKEWARSLEQLEALMAGSSFAAGASFTIADIVIGHCFGWARNAKLDEPAGPVGAYMAKLYARPARRRVLEIIANMG